MPVLEPKDYLTLSISVASAVIALTSLVLTYRQRVRENTRGIREALTNTLGSLADVNLAMARLRLEHPESTDQVVALRRSYNTQRRYLANHAEYLLQQIPTLATDVDHNLLAQAFESMQHYDKAREHWELCIEKAPAPSLRAFNLRGFGRYLFFQGNFNLGRQKFEESLRVEMPDNDSSRRLRADTLALWSATERDFGFTEEGRRIREQALGESKRIGHQGMREEISSYINSFWAEQAQLVPPGSALAPSTEQTPEARSPSSA